MTVEEAVEIILSGVAWCGCTDCDDTGLVSCKKGEAPGFAKGFLDEYLKIPCKRCYGTGWRVTPHYEEACRMLGKPLPKYESEGPRPARVKTPLFKMEKIVAFQPYEYPVSSLIEQSKKKPDDT